MNCFVCSDYLDGDDQFIQSHLNRCLDRQGSSTGNQPTAASLSTASSSQRPPSFSQDEALALSLAQQDQLQYNVQPTGGRKADESEESACPCCQVLWEDIGLYLPPNSTPTNGQREKIEDKKRNHVMKCLEAREGLHGPGGGGEEEGGELGDGYDEEPLQHGGYAFDPDPARPQVYETDSTKGKTLGWNGGIGTKLQVQGTSGLLPLVRQALSKSHSSPYGKTMCAYLANDRVDHVGPKFGDWGWGCGYKNLQILISSARYLPQYRSLLHDLTGQLHTPPTEKDSDMSTVPIPTILELQRIIRTAWSLGFDKAGATHFNYKLVGSKRWIGTTEVFTALSYLGFRARIVDFPKVKKGQDGNSDGTHQTLVKWIISYFSTPSPLDSSVSTPTASSSSSSDSQQPKNGFTTLLSNRQSSPIQTVSSHKQPLYLQHQGHSRTIVGVERMKGSSNKGGEGDGEEWLLIFDPGKPISSEIKQLATASSAPDPPPAAKKFKPNGFGQLKSNSAAAATTDNYKFGDVLKVFRVNMKNLKKKDEYQILYIEENGLPLTGNEKEDRKTVMADLGKGVWRPLPTGAAGERQG